MPQKPYIYTYIHTYIHPGIMSIFHSFIKSKLQTPKTSNLVVHLEITTNIYSENLKSKCLREVRFFCPSIWPKTCFIHISYISTGKHIVILGVFTVYLANFTAKFHHFKTTVTFDENNIFSSGFRHCARKSLGYTFVTVLTQIWFRFLPLTISALRLSKS